MFDTAEAAFGGVDVLVNNAGIMKTARIADTDDALFDQHVAPERLGTPQDITGVVSFLASPDGSWINGQTLRANGGMISSGDLPLRNRSVAVGPGATELTAMSRLRSSLERIPVMVSTAAFVAAYTPWSKRSRCRAWRRRIRAPRIRLLSPPLGRYHPHATPSTLALPRPREEAICAPGASLQ